MNLVIKVFFEVVDQLDHLEHVDDVDPDLVHDGCGFAVYKGDPLVEGYLLVAQIHLVLNKACFLIRFGGTI